MELVSEKVSRMYRRVEATAANVGLLRRTLRAWLSDVVVDDDCVGDLTLAANEALENVVDHAFLDQPSVGTITLTAEVTDIGVRKEVVISVADDGRWQPPAPDRGFRGRGLAMIARLADAHVLSPSGIGTLVTLRHPC